MSGSITDVLAVTEALCRESATLYSQYRDHGNSDRDLLTEALGLIEQALYKTATDMFVHDDHRAEYLAFQCRFLLDLFIETSQETYLDQAIQASQESLEVAVVPSQLRPLCAVNLSDSLAESFFFRGAGKPTDLQSALSAAREAVDSSKEGAKYHSIALSTLASRLGQCCEYIEEKGDYLNEAILIGHRLVRIGTGTRGIYMFNLAADLKLRFQRYGDIEDLATSLSYFRETAEIYPLGHTEYFKAAIALASCVADMAKETHCLDGIDDNLSKLAALDREVMNAGDILKLHHSMSLLYHTRYDISSNPDDLNNAIEAAKDGLRGISTADARGGIILTNLSNVLSKRATIELSAGDMDLAVDYATQAVELSAGFPAQQSDAYTTLGNRLSARYDTFGGLEDMINSLDAKRRAVALLAKNHRNRPTRISNLAIELRNHFEYYGNIAFLDESISLQREASRFEIQNRIDHCIILSGLDIALSLRHRLTGSSQDLKEAISASEAAVTGAEKGSAVRPAYLNNLALRLLARFSQHGDQSDLERAASAIAEAVEADGDDVVYLTTMSNCLIAQYGVSGESSDLEKAVETARQVLRRTARSRPSRLAALHNLGLRLYTQYENTASGEEKLRLLQESWKAASECVAESPENHPDLPDYLCQLATRQLNLGLFMDESDEPKLIAQVRLAAETFHRAFDKKYHTPLGRIESGRTTGYMYMQLDEFEIASTILSETVNLFRRVSPTYLDASDRQRRLQGLSGTSALACAAYLSLNRPGQGVEILEAGRGIMANIAMGYQADLSAIKEANQTLYDQYISLRDSVSRPLLSPSSHGNDVVRKRMSDVSELEKTEELIRDLPGFNSFNLSLTVQQMQELAMNGPVVSFCTVDKRCDALVITKDSIECLPLPNLRNADIKTRVPLIVGPKRLSLAGPMKRASANKKMRSLLSWLWDSAVCPVLTHLGLIQEERARPLTRLWWVMSGPLGLLPLHVAGKGHQIESQNVFSHVISSYTPSLAALSFARQCQAKADTISPKMALVTMPQSPGGLPVLSTERETLAIREAIRSTNGCTQVLHLSQPDAADVLYNVRNRGTNILHLACHAEPDPKDPSNSALLFGSDPEAESPDAVPIKELMEYRGPPSETHQRPLRLAYLSACCTAQQYDLRLIDENLHLAAAFQLLGFPAVVGSLWEADDTAASFVAGVFYRELFCLDEHQQRDGVAVQLGDNVATALHVATLACRKRKLARGNAADDVLCWASFVHLGA